MLTTSPSLDRTKQKNNASLCDVNLCDINLCDVKLCDVSVCVCGVNLCDVKLCDVNLCDVNLCDVNLCDVKLCDVNLCDVNLCDVKLCDVNLCDVNLCGVNLCDVKLCDVNLCDFNLRDVNLCDVNLCDVKLCDVNLCDVNLCDVKLCDVSVRVCVMSICVVSVCVMSICVMSICVISICVMSTCVMSICVMSSCVTSIFVMSICAMSSGVMSVCVCVMSICVVISIYTQQGAKPACQQDIHTQCSHLLLAQLPRTQFTHSKAPNPHASKTSTQNFRTSYWHSYPERNLHTASRQTRMPGRHRRKIFAAPIGTATPNTIYTQQAAKTACQQDINSKFSQLLLAQLPRTQFTQSTPPNPHASRTSTQNFRSSYWHSYPERNLHTASRQTRMPGRHQHAKAAAERRSPKRAKAYIRPLASAPSPTPAVQKQRQSGGAQNAPKRTSDPVQVLQVPRLPRKSSGRAAEPKTRQSVHQTPCECSKPHACHKKAAAERRSPKRAKAYIRPRASAPSPTPATQKQRQSGGAQNAPKRTSDPVQVLQVPRLPRKSSGRAAEPKTRQSVHQTPCKRSKSHACHAKAAAERRSPNRAKAYIRPRASAPSPTPATQKQRKSGGAQNAPKRTSDPVQALQVPRLPRKSSGRAAEPKTRQSVHQTPCKCSKSHACHAKAAAERRSPKRAKAYIRPRASAPSPTRATQKQRQSGGAQNAPKRTSDPAQVLQVPRVPRKSSGRAAEPKTRQSVHQTPCKCSKSHACHAKAAEERRSPKRAKAYIRPRASAPSPTPATQKQRQSGGAQNAPKRTSDPVQVLQVPRLPRKSSGRAAEPKTRQSVHQTPCKCSKSHACHAKAAAKAAPSCVMSSCAMSSCVMCRCVMSSCVMSSCVMSSCVMSSCVMSTCVMSSSVM